MPVTRPEQLPPRDRQGVKVPPTALTDDWTVYPFSLWRATKITLSISANPIEVQLSRDDPPDPPTWDDPIPVPVGQWSHVGRFGYARFRNLTPGKAGLIYGSLSAE